MISFNVTTEFGKLEAVLIHSPGAEVENMTPATAERALYSDILNLSVASKEYTQFKSILARVSDVYEVKELFTLALQDPSARKQVIADLSSFTSNPTLPWQLQELSDDELCRQILEGIPWQQKSLSNFLNKDRFALSPLHNIFFTRDSAFTIGNTVFIGSMAKSIRVPESIVMKTLFEFAPGFEGNVLTLHDKADCIDRVTIEGGDVLLLSEKVLVLGIGSRTSARGVDRLIEQILKFNNLEFILIQELPDSPESFIHLDMVFTLLSQDECMIYKPLLLGENRYHSVLMHIQNRKVSKIEYVENILAGLRISGHNMQAYSCGGNSIISQEREQWHSGANFFAYDAGKLIGYERNVHTSEELYRNGYSIITAKEVIEQNIDLTVNKKMLITIEGSELSRGGGGARCMTMPLRRL